jgi:hypothetical protein
MVGDASEKSLRDLVFWGDFGDFGNLGDLGELRALLELEAAHILARCRTISARAVHSLQKSRGWRLRRLLLNMFRRQDLRVHDILVCASSV